MSNNYVDQFVKTGSILVTEEELAEVTDAIEEAGVEIDYEKCEYTEPYYSIVKKE